MTHQRPGVSDEHRIVPLRKLARQAILEAEEGAVRSCWLGHRWNRWLPLPVRSDELADAVLHPLRLYAGRAAMTLRAILVLAWFSVWPAGSMLAGIYLATRPQRAPDGFFWIVCVVVWPLMPMFVWWERCSVRARLPAAWRAGV